MVADDRFPARERKTAAKRSAPASYHHGDLRRALLEEAVRTIQTHGVEALTLRTVGERLGVSRTALYRHFADKPALLAAVGREGFRLLRLALTEAWEQQRPRPRRIRGHGHRLRAVRGRRIRRTTA